MSNYENDGKIYRQLIDKMTDEELGRVFSTIYKDCTFMIEEGMFRSKDMHHIAKTRAYLQDFFHYNIIPQNYQKFSILKPALPTESFNLDSRIIQVKITTDAKVRIYYDLGRTKFGKVTDLKENDYFSFATHQNFPGVSINSYIVESISIDPDSSFANLKLRTTKDFSEVSGQKPSEFEQENNEFKYNQNLNNLNE